MRVVHLVTHFVCRNGKTRCGIFSDSLTAYRAEATCKRCLRMMLDATIHCDGAANPTNPGPAGAGYVIEIGGAVILRGDPLGWATNNVAEYEAVIRALTLAADRGARSATVMTDSKLVVMQVTGEWRVHENHLAVLRARVQNQVSRFEGGVEFEWIPREQNERADRQSKIGSEKTRAGMPAV